MKRYLVRLRQIGRSMSEDLLFIKDSFKKLIYAIMGWNEDPIPEYRLTTIIDRESRESWHFTPQEATAKIPNEDDELVEPRGEYEYKLFYRGREITLSSDVAPWRKSRIPNHLIYY